MNKIRRRNTRGQSTSEKMVEIKLTKVLKDIEYEYKIRLHALIRDELAKELRNQMYISYVPTGSGEYEHTRRLLTSVYAVIEGDVIKAKLANESYKGIDSEGNIIDIPVEDVYNYLKFGTTNSPKSDVYPYLDENGKVAFAKYTSTPPHNFEAETRKAMNKLLGDIAKNPEGVLGPYLKKYQNKRL